MRKELAAGLLVYVALACASACGAEEENPAVPRTRADAGSGLVGDGTNGTGTGAGTGAFTGLPCNVQQLLENRCIACHLAGASVAPLLTYEDLLKPSSDPSKNLAVKSLERMKSTAAPMPPAPAEAPTAEEIQILQAWVDTNTPKGEACTGTDGGAPGGGTSFNTPSVCTSNARWTRGNEGGANMRPGGACIACHAAKGPSYTIAGTVYPTAHEPNDCNGSNGAGLTVVVTGANGAVTNINVNSVGNFSSRASVVAPFRVKVTDGTKERVMVGTLTAGDCNSCHTEAGLNGAPGRVVAP